MKKTLCAGFLTGLVMMGMVGMAEATSVLETIGTASYNGNTYNMNYDSGAGLTWLDYTNANTNWQAQSDWAAGLGGQLTVNLAAGWTGAAGWDSTAWRLPSAGTNPHVEYGYNQIGSEMGDLFYNELGLSGYYNSNGVVTTVEQLNAPGAKYDFDNLKDTWYWSGTECAANPLLAWRFKMGLGLQDDGHPKDGPMYGLAVRSGQVTYSAEAAQTPLPGAVWLLGSGLAGLIGARRKKK